MAKAILDFDKSELDFLIWVMGFMEGGPFDADKESMRAKMEEKFLDAYIFQNES